MEYAAQSAPETEEGASIGAVLSELADDFSLLVCQELALARAEVFGKFGQLRMGAVLLAASALIAFAGLLGVMGAGAAALAMVLPVWAAALIVGGGVLLIAAILGAIGASRMRAENLVPRRTVRSLRRDAQWAGEQVR